MLSCICRLAANDERTKLYAAIKRPPFSTRDVGQQEKVAIDEKQKSANNNN